MLQKPQPPATSEIYGIGLALKQSSVLVSQVSPLNSIEINLYGNQSAPAQKTINCPYNFITL